MPQYLQSTSLADAQHITLTTITSYFEIRHKGLSASPSFHPVETFLRDAVAEQVEDFANNWHPCPHMEISQEQLHGVMPCAPPITPHGGIDHIVPPFADLHSALDCLANVRCAARRREAEHGCRRCGELLG